MTPGLHHGRRVRKLTGRVIFALLLVASLGAMPLHAADQASPEERRRQDFYQCLIQRGERISRQALSEGENRQQWEARRSEVRQRLLYMLGLDPLPPKTPLHAVITGVVERPAFRIEKVVYQSLPSLYVTGNLYIPKRGTKPFPAVVYVCGHSPGPTGAKTHYQHHGMWFAEHGFVALVLDTLEFGEVPGIHHGLYDQNMWQWLSLGYTPAGVEVWNAMRAVDFLESRPEVDPRRLALTGVSGGGAISWYAGAVDERFAVVVPVHGTYTVESQAVNHGVEENCDCIFYPNIYQQDLSLAGALIAPRPLKFLDARRDPMFPPAGYNAVYEKLKKVYAWYGAPDKVEVYDEDVGHSDTPSIQAQAHAWIQQWLQGDRSPVVPGAAERIPEQDLVCLAKAPSDARNYRIQDEFTHPVTLEMWKTEAAWSARREQLLTQLREKVFRAFPQSPVPLDAVRKPNSDTWANGYADVFDVSFASESSLRVSGLLFRPRQSAGSRPALIYVKGRHDSISGVDFDALLPLLGKADVLVLQPRATDFPIDDRQWVTLERTAEIMGETVESMQVWDIMRAVDFMVSDLRVDPAQISVYGKGEMGVLALYAAIFDGRPARAVLDRPPDTHWVGPQFLNILRITDLPEAAALMAPREIVALTALPAAYSYTASIYALGGNKAEFRRAGDLVEALKLGAP